MDIVVRLAFHETALVRVLHGLALENARILRTRPELPLLYDSHVVYQREDIETWCDVVYTLDQGHEDCDGLAAYRVGELRARGVAAVQLGDPGYQPGLRGRVEAEVMLTAESARLYHCVARYRINRGPWLVDDPSARLGMGGRPLDPYVLERRYQRGRNA